MADTEPTDNAFSNTNSHSDATLSPDRDSSGPRVKDGPGREWIHFLKLPLTASVIYMHLIVQEVVQISLLIAIAADH